MPLQINRKALVILILLAVAVLAGGVVVASKMFNKEARAKQFLEEARSLTAEGRDARAIIQYMNVIAYDPENVAAYIELADLHVKTGNLNEAYRYYKAGSDKDPRNVEVLSKLAECYHLAGQWENLRKAAARIISLAPGGRDQGRAHHYLAQAYYVDKDYEKSAEEFRKVRDFDDTNVDAVFSLAFIEWRHLGRQADAELTLKILLDRAANDSLSADERAEAAVRAARFYGGTGRREEAEGFYKKAIELGEGQPRYWIALGDYYRQAGRDERHRSLAENAYLKALEVGPTDGNAHLSLGVFYRDTGRTDKVIEILEKAIATEKTAAYHQLYYQHLIDALLARSDFDAARRRLDDLRSLKDVENLADYLEGRIYLAQAKGYGENLIKAERLFARVTKAMPRFPHAYYYLGLCLAARGALDDAKLELQRALAVAGEFTEASIALGETYLQTRDFDRALLQALSVLEKDPTDFRANLIAGRAQLALGNDNAAINFLQQAVKVQPSSVEGYIALADVYSTRGNYDKAVEVLEEAAPVAEDTHRARMALTLIYHERGDSDRALKVASALASESPADASMADFYASLLSRLGRGEDALDFVRKRVERYGDSPEYLRVLGNLQRALGDNEGSLESFSRAQELAPGGREAIAGAADALVSLGRFDEARAQLRLLEQADPGSPTGDLLEAKMLRVEGKNNAAAALVSNTLRQNPSNAEAHYLLAMIHQDRGEVTKAIESLKSSLKYNPSSVRARLALAEAYYHTRYFDDALREASLVAGRGELDPRLLQRAVRITAGSLVEHERVSDAIKEWSKLPPEIRKTGDYELKLGYLYLLGKQYDEAEKSFLRAGELLASKAPAFEGLAQVMLALGRTEEALAEARKGLEMAPDGVTRVRLLGILASAAMKAGDEESALAALEASVEAARDNAVLMIQAGDSFLALGRREKAIETYRKAAALPGSPVEAKRRLVLALTDAGRFDEALSLARDILRSNPGDFGALVLNSQVFIAQRKPKEAAELLEKALSLPDLDAKASAAARYLLAEANYQSGLLPTAETQLRRALAQDPTLTPARLLLAEVQLRIGSYEQAAVTARDVIAAEPENARAYGILADATRLSGNPEQAISYYRKILSMGRNKAALIALVQVLETLGRQGEATREIEKFFQGDPSDADVAWMLAKAYEGAGEHSKAEEVLKAAIEAGADRGKLDGPLALVYRNQGKFDEAEAVLKEVIGRDPSPEVYRALAGLYGIAGKRGEAEKTFRDAIDLYPDFLPNYVDLASLLAQDSGFDKGLDILKQGVSANGEVEAFHEAVARFYISAGRQNEAEEFIKGALREKPRFADLACTLADLYYSRDDFDNALATYEEALKAARSPAVKARAANGAAYILAEKGTDLDRAIELASTANIQRPEDWGILDTLGWAYYRAGQYNKAVVNLARAAELAAGASGETLYHLSLAYSKAGMVANARETAEILVAADASWAQREDIQEILAQE
ncbi:MAG: tetratricopeptide repeat protein [Planctomycetota bacterium]|jgi:tetratricopeptide (TPR) repeat protein